MPEKPEPVAIAGAGYVGLVTAVGFAERGHDVWLAEKDDETLTGLRNGEVKIAEPGLQKAVLASWERFNFVASTGEALDKSGARVLIVAVGTPPRPDGSADLKRVDEVIGQIREDAEITVVMKSTVPPGTGERILRRARAAGARFSYVSCPEFLREGRALRDVRNPDRIVVGGDAEARKTVQALHTHVDREKIIDADLPTAETIKHMANFHLAMRISFANEAANFCEEMGADVRKVMDGIGMDPRIGPKFLRPGVGFGGSCLIKDLQALRAAANLAGYRITLADAVLQVNEDQADRVIRKLLRHLGSLEGRRIALLGLAFKPETGDIRSGPAFALAGRLRHLHASIRAYDPESRACAQALEHAERKATAAEWIDEHELAKGEVDAMEGADACVIVTDWEQFRTIDWDKAKAAMSGELVIDGRNILKPEEVEAAGLTYEGTGHKSAGLWRDLSAGDDEPEAVGAAR